MKEHFYKKILEQHLHTQHVPSNTIISGWAEKLICILYPQLAVSTFRTEAAVQTAMATLQNELETMLRATSDCSEMDHCDLAGNFFDAVPEIYYLLNTDIEALIGGDPAARSEFEVIRAYPGFYALCFYRIAHELHKLGVPIIARILTEQAHSKTGIDIHPAAVIDEYFFIDHGTGIVIGETARIGRHVKLYQGVTLGALSVTKEMAFTKRHPTVEDYVVIYSGATILGGDTTIGHHSIIGGNVWLTSSVAPGSLVYHNPEITVVEGKLLKD